MELLYKNYSINEKIPVLEVIDKSIKHDVPCIIFFHGLTASYETHFKEINELAERGFRVIAVDNAGHGRRKYSDFEERFAEDNLQRLNNINIAINETARDVPDIIDFIYSNNLSKSNSIGVAGISMGGFVTYQALKLDSRIDVAVPILGSPEWEFELCDNNLGEFVKTLENTKLLSVNAEKDELVPAIGSEALHKKLKERYQNYFSNYAFIELEGAGHFMDEDSWNKCWGATVKWFEKHLS